MKGVSRLTSHTALDQMAAGTEPENGWAHVMMSRTIAAVLVAVSVAGCSGASNLLKTGSLTGSDSKPAEAAPQVQNDPATRALQVGSTSARALKCGFNFDPVKLRTQFLAAESAIDPANVQKAQTIYDTAYRGVSRGVATKGEEYCTSSKVAMIKSALTRHMAGDYTPDPPAPVAEDEGGGLFGGFGNTSGSTSTGLDKLTKPQSEW
jgi:hypothetical protein